jgi:hypothetical protein
MEVKVCYAVFPDWLARRFVAVTLDRVSLSLLRLRFRVLRAVRVVS